MAVIRKTEKGVELLARLMRAEAVGDGDQAMLRVGNVGVNRVRSGCLDFTGMRNIRDMVFQSPGGFEATMHSLFYQRAREREKKLARRAISGKRFWPASYSLWFFEPQGSCPSEWYGEPFTGQYKSFCYYHPTQQECSEVYNTF